MADAKPTWIYKLSDSPDAALHQASGRTFKEATKALEDEGLKPTLVRREWTKYAWPGGYPIFYIVKDGGCLCADCSNGNMDKTLDPDDQDWYIMACDINWEDPTLYCDNCAKFIESAYAEIPNLDEFIEGDKNA
jgi:hypothetical protein